MTRKLLYIIITILGTAQCFAQAKPESHTTTACDSVVFQTVLYFNLNVGKSIPKSEQKKIAQLLDWAKANDTIPIMIVGKTDKSGPLDFNNKLSLQRANFIRSTLIKKGVNPNRISAIGAGVGSRKLIDKTARQASVYGIIQVEVGQKNNSRVETAPIVENIQPEIIAIQDSTPTTVTNNATEQPAQPIAITAISPWYIGIGGGVAFGRGTLCSFSEGKTHPGFNVKALGGYKINSILSIEASIDYNRLTLASFDCCHNLYLCEDGNRYFAPVSGKKNYAYKDLIATTDIFDLGINLNIDLVGIWNANSRWSALVSPVIYGSYSRAKVRELNTVVKQDNKFHVGAGASVGVGYKITRQLGLRLTTGINIYSGTIDAMPQEEHRTAYLWRSNFTVLFNL